MKCFKLLPLLFLSCKATVTSLGSCPNVRGVRNFDQNRYLGSWYEYANVFEFYQIGSTCVRATYTDLGNKIGVFNEQVNSITGGYGNVKGSARPAKRSGEFIVGFDNIPFGGGGGGNTPNYRVVDTDYTSYAIVYDCSPFLGFLKKESLWLLTRAQFPSKYLVSAAYRKMDKLGLPRKDLAKTPQNNCKDLPPPGSATFQLSIESLG